MDKKERDGWTERCVGAGGLDSVFLVWVCGALTPRMLFDKKTRRMKRTPDILMNTAFALGARYPILTEKFNPHAV